MPVNFPSSPSLNDTYTYNGKTYVYNGVGWRLFAEDRVLAPSTFGTDNRLLRADGSGRLIQSTGITIDDSDNMSGVAQMSATSIELGHASDTTITRTAAGRIAVEGDDIFASLGYTPLRPYGTAAIATTSGTTASFTGLPASIRRLTFIFREVSLTTTDNIRVRLGTSGGLVTSGYVGTAVDFNNASGNAGASSTAGFDLRNGAEVNTASGAMTVMRHESNVWVAWHHGKRSASANQVVWFGGGSIDLGAELTQAAVLVTAGAFDGGSVNLLWEF